MMTTECRQLSKVQWLANCEKLSQIRCDKSHMDARFKMI